MSFSEWKEYRLGEVTENHDNKRVPLSSKQRSSKHGQYPYYGAQGVIDYIDDYIFEGEYLLVAEDGANLETRNEDIARLTDVKEKFWVNNHAHILRSNNKSDIRFIKYFLNRTDISGYVTGSAQPKLNKSNLNNIKVFLPSFNEQKCIADILSTIDKKIEINNQINRNLQALSQLLFKHWFIDFEFPNEQGLSYKSSGGEMVNSVLGMVPKGWEVKQLKEVKEMGTLVMGQSPSGSSYNQDKIGMPLINGAADIKDGNLVPNKYTTEPKKITKENDLIFCIRATIGLLTISDGEYCLGRGVAAITNIKDNHYEYIYQVIDSSFEKFEKTASGSVYINLSKDDFNNMKLIVPSDEVLERYHNICAPILKLITSNKKQIANLANLRDTLLPKLMSREIDLSNLEIGI